MQCDFQSHFKECEIETKDTTSHSFYIYSILFHRDWKKYTIRSMESSIWADRNASMPTTHTIHSEHTQFTMKTTFVCISKYRMWYEHWNIQPSLGVINDLFIVLNTQKRPPLFLSFAELMSRDKCFHRFLLAKFNHPTDLLQLPLPFSM